MLRGLVVVLAAITVMGTLLSFSRRPEWWIRAFDFPRLQFAVLGIVALALLPFVFQLHWFDIALVAATLAAVLWQSWRILPYTPLFKKQVLDARGGGRDDTIALMVANVLTPNRQAQQLLALVRDANPDVILTLETDQWWQDQLQPLERAYPYTLQCPLDNLYGMHLYSRLELRDAQIRYLVEEDIPSMHARVIMRNGHVLELHGVHPTPPSPTENDSSVERDAELLVVGRDLPQDNRSVIVAGDLNDVAWSRTTNLFQKISGLLDPRIGRGLFSTFHAKYWFLRWPLDHLFHSDDFTLVSLRRLPKFGSDHFPILVVLRHDPPAEAKQDGPHADAEDRAEAEALIEAGDAEHL